MTTLETYVKWINEFYCNNQDLKELQVITSIDTEGECFCPVKFKPSKGLFLGDTYTTLVKNRKNLNAICLN